MSVSKALSKYGGTKKKNNKKRSRSRKKRSWETSDSEGDDDDNDESMSQKLSQEQFSQLTESVNTLVSRGSDFEIYGDTQASLDAKIRRGRNELGQWKSEGKVWFLKWSAEDVKVEGPSTSSDMKSWHAGGYFKEKEILLRKVGDETWTLAKDFDFSSLSS